MNAVIIPSNITETVCAMKYHGKDPKKNLCANHSDSCEQAKKTKVSMCFAAKHCDICGHCNEHCLGHHPTIRRDPLTGEFNVG